MNINNFIVYYESGRFVDYNYMILDQISYNEDINYKLSSIDKDVDIFKNFVFRDLEYKDLLYIYSFHEEVFYEIKFKFNISNYLSLLNFILITLDNGSQSNIHFIIKMDKGIIYINNEKLNNKPHILNLDQVMYILNNSTNYSEAYFNESDEYEYVSRDVSENLKELIYKSKKDNFEGFTVIDDRNEFKVTENKIICGDKEMICNNKIFDCRNLNKKELLVLLQSKKTIIKYYVLDKETFAYIKFSSMNDVIEYMNNYYILLRESLVYEKQ